MKKITKTLFYTVHFIKSSKGAFLYALLFLAFLIAGFYLTFTRGAVDSLIDQTQLRQKVVVETGADSIENFINLLGDNLVTLATDPRIRTGTQVNSALEDFIDPWANTSVVGIFFTDNQGVVRYVENRQEAEDQLGVDVSDREYFVGAKKSKKNEYYVGEVVYTKFGIVEGKPVIPISTSVYTSEGEFLGVLTLAVHIEDFFDEYLESIRITEKTRIFLLDRKGNFIVNPTSEDIGKNVFDFIDKLPEIGREFVRERAEETFHDNFEETGLIDRVVPLDFEEDAPLKRVLVVYTPVQVDHAFWVLAVSTPVEEALVFVTPFYMRQIAGFAVIAAMFLVVSIRIARIEGFGEVLSAGEEKNK